MGKTKIQWTDETDNVIVVRGEDGKQDGWYCQKVSPGCAHCYAERMNVQRFGNGMAYRVPADGSVPPLMLREDILAGWARQQKPRRHFVNSMTDTFAHFVPHFWIFDILDAMTAAPRQTFQLLTKRAGRMREIVGVWLQERGLAEVPANIWLGVSVENQEWADKRIPELLGVPAAVRFASVEPLLERVTFSPVIGLREFHGSSDRYKHVFADWLWHLDWVIVGGESGPNARPMHPDWARDLRNQCVNAGVPFFFKQWGEWLPLDQPAPADFGEWWKEPAHKRHRFPDGVVVERVGKLAAGRLLDGREWNEFPQEVSHV